MSDDKQTATKVAPAKDVDGAEDGDEEQVETGVKAQANKEMQNVSAFDDEAGDNVDEDKLGKAMSFLTDVNKKQKAQQSARDKELAKVVIGKEDVELIMNEFQVTKVQAEQALRENKGNVLNTMRQLVSVA
ncbi:CG9922-like protein [Powellomyces hirtus]|nr:CG9922-like protein [Powellomyces hirtus]